MAGPKFPKTLYVRREVDSDGTVYLHAIREIAEINEEHAGSRIGVYRLVEIKTLRVGEKTLE